MSREWAGHRYWNLTLPNSCGNDQKGHQSELYTEALNQGVCPELPGISCRLNAEGLGKDLQRGFCRAGPGSCILIISMPLGSSQQLPTAVQTPGYDGHRWLGDQENRAAAVGSCRKPAGLIHGCSAKGAGGRLKDSASSSGTFPWVLEQVGSNHSDSQLSLLSLGLR